MKKLVPLLSTSLILFSLPFVSFKEKTLQNADIFQNDFSCKASAFDGESEYYSKYTNLIGNIVYKRSVTLKNTFYFPNATYEGEKDDTGVFVPDNVIYNLVFIVDGNVSDEKEIEISGKGYHNVKVSTYFLENGIKRVSKSYLEDFTFFISPLEYELTLGQTTFYFEYYSSFDALIDDVASKCLVYKDGTSFKTTLDKGTIEALRYNYNEVMYEYNLNSIYENDVVLNGLDVPLVVKSSRAKDEAKEIYRLLPTSNDDLVIDYVDLVGKDESTDYKTLVKGLMTGRDVKGHYDVFNGLVVEVKKGEDVKVYEGSEIVEEGTPFAKTFRDSSGEFDFDKFFKDFVVSSDTIDLKDGTRNDFKDTNATIDVDLVDYSGTKVEFSKDIYLVDYRMLKSDTRFSLKLNRGEKRSFLSYKDVSLSSPEIFNTVPYVEISLPSASLILKDYEGVTNQKVNKYRIDTTKPGTYENTYLLEYKTDKLKEVTYTEKFKVIDDINPFIISKYDVFYFDKIDKSAFLENYTNYVRFEDDEKIDYSSVKVSTPDNFMSDKETYFTVEVSDTSGNTTKKDFKVIEKTVDPRSDLEKGWDAFCYNWGEFFRKLFGVTL